MSFPTFLDPTFDMSIKLQFDVHRTFDNFTGHSKKSGVKSDNKKRYDLVAENYMPV